jgi:GAF domain-containing protein/HAMP domain-containing protein
MIRRFLSPPNIKDDEEKKRFGFWGNLPLSRKLLLAFGVMFIFAVIIAVVTLNGLNRTQAAYEKALAEGIEIRTLSEQLETSLLQARSNEKNFLLHWREEGFYTAKLNYATPYMQNIADMRAQLTQLSAFGSEMASSDSAAQGQYEANITSLNQNVDAYEESFNALVNAYQNKGFDDSSTDLESQFRLTARQLEAKFSGRAGTETGLEDLQALFFRIRLNEKDYLLSTDPNYINTIHAVMPQLKTQIALSDQLDPAEKSQLLTQADEYVAAIDALVELDKKIATYNEVLINASSTVEALTAQTKDLGGQLATEDINTARTNNAQTLTISIITVFAVLVLSILLAVTLSQQLTRPIISLTNTAQEISSGKFDIQAQVNSADEIGILARTFNTMTGQLRGALQNLDRRAQELEQQTVQLELTSQQSEKRAHELQTIAEIARYISTEKDLKKLLPLITQTVSTEFGFYHIGIFLLDEGGKFAVLQASNSLGGQEMLKRQHRLEVGQTGIVGNATATGTPRIALDTGADATFFNNPYLPQTRSEMALPLKIEKRVIGALDIQSTEINAFSEEDIEALTTLADQVSIAIQNARLFNEVEKSLAESNAIQRQYISESWSHLSKEEKLIGYQYSDAGVIQLDDETITAATQNMKDKREINVPITLRGEMIGTLSVQVPKSEHIGTDQMDLIKAVAERVALSAENARLFEETSRRAERERIISDIASKIGTSVRTESILRTTASELSHLLDDADIFIDLHTMNKEKKDTE